jgi:citrate synthase
MSETAKGLAGLIAADSILSSVNGETGELIYRGYDIMDLGENACFEEVVYLLWHGDLPNRSQLDTFRAALVAKRDLPTAALNMMTGFSYRTHPMAVLRTTVSGLGLIDESAEDASPEGARRKHRFLGADS